ncbi:MAG: hypothetical protein PHW66_09450 [Gallionella sp.]|nr:hypothetical protein [Gallionella sp.]
MRDAPSNIDDVIDSRDVIARIEELESELQDEYEAESEEPANTFEEWVDAAAANDTHTLQDAAEELKTLKSLADQGEGYGDWEHGETLIRESYFQDYAQELAEDCGMIPKDLAWPCTCIDWEQACRELKMDYTEVDFDGVSYFMRA